MPTSPQSSWSRLRRWLRHTWLARLPVVDRLLGPLSAQLSSKKKPRRENLHIEELERRWVANDMLALGTTALAGGVVAEMSATYRTPTQVLMHGWGTNPFAPSDRNRPNKDDESSAAHLLPNNDLDHFFLSLTVAPPPVAEAATTPRQQEEPNTEESNTTRQDERLVSATSALSDPLHAADFLNRVAAALADPVEEATDGEGKERSGGGGGGSGGFPTYSAEAGGGDSGQSSPSIEMNNSAPSGDASGITLSDSPDMASLAAMGMFSSQTDFGTPSDASTQGSPNGAGTSQGSPTERRTLPPPA